MILKKKSINLINLNNKRKKIEQNILNSLDFEKIKKENKNVIIYHDNNIHEGLIGIIAARLKDHFNKPSIVITKSNNYLKASARSTSSYNVGHLIKLLIDKKIIENGGGHNLAAGFSFKKKNIYLLRSFIEKDFSKKNINLDNSIKYDSEISASAINSHFLNEISKLGPFGNENLLPIFFIKNVKIIKSEIIKEKHISVLIKPNIGPPIKSICFNSVNSKLGEYLLSYKKEINLIVQIHQNFWNNKKTFQLNIKDLIL